MRYAVIAALMTALLASTQAGAQGESGAPRPAQIDRNGTLILIRTTLLALHEANQTGNYTVLRDMSAPGFREANTAARLAEIFASQRAQRLDLSGVAVLEPQLTTLPQIESNGLLHLAGFFPSFPVQVSFELLYAAVDGRWRPFGIKVNVGSSSPSAPATQSPTGTIEPKPSDSRVAEPKAFEPKAVDSKSNRPSR